MAFRKFYNKATEYIEVQMLLSTLIAGAAVLLSIKAFAGSVIKVDGSSTVFPITEAVAEEFQKVNGAETKVTVGISGTGGGFKKFCRGETDVQDASRPIQSGEMETCKSAGIKFFELPIAYDAMVIVTHPKNTFLKSINLDELKKMWEPEAQGKIMKWNQVNAKWPDQPLKLFGAGSDSGTFDYFTEAVVGKAKASRGDYTASEDDNTLVMGISTDKNAIGYVPLSYYEENKTKLMAVAVIGGPKSPKKDAAVMPNKENVVNGTYFPFSRPIFIYVNEASFKKPEVKAFVTFYIKNAKQLSEQVKYVALPEKAYTMGEELITKGKLGTMFGGHSEVGLRVEELMKREGKL